MSFKHKLFLIFKCSLVSPFFFPFIITRFCLFSFLMPLTILYSYRSPLSLLSCRVGSPMPCLRSFNSSIIFVGQVLCFFRHVFRPLLVSPYFYIRSFTASTALDLVHEAVCVCFFCIAITSLLKRSLILLPVVVSGNGSQPFHQFVRIEVLNMKYRGRFGHLVKKIFSNLTFSIFLSCIPS